MRVALGITATPRPAKIAFGYLYSLHLALACVFTTAVNDPLSVFHPNQSEYDRPIQPRGERGKEKARRLFPVLKPPRSTRVLMVLLFVRVQF